MVRGLVLLGVVACSSTATPIDAGDEASTKDAHVDVVTPDAADASDGVATERYEGYVTLYRDNPSDYSVVAAFALPPGAGCTVPVDVGGCQYVSCDYTGASSGFAASAGTIQIDGTSPPITLTSGAYVVPPTSGKLWSGGETLSATSTGGVVPPFALSMVAPDAITITAPPWPGPVNPLVVDKSKSLVISWSAGAVGNVQIVLGDDAQASNSVTVTCTFDETAGSGSIDPAAFAPLVASASPWVNVDVAARATKAVDVWTLSFNAALTVASAPVQFQ